MGRRDVLLLSILTLVTSLAWIAFDVYHAYVTSTIPQALEQTLLPITPRFDRTAVEKVKGRQNIDPLTTLTLKETEALPATPALQPTATPPLSGETATQSGGQ